jgi:hypothetical protein
MYVVQGPLGLPPIADAASRVFRPKMTTSMVRKKSAIELETSLVMIGKSTELSGRAYNHPD